MHPTAILAATASLAAVAAGLLWLRERAARRADAAAVQRDRRLAVLAEHPTDVLLLLDPGGRILEANARAEATYGWPRAELLRRTESDLRAPSARASSKGQLARALEGERLTFDTVHLRRDGSEFPVEVSTTSVAGDRDGWILAVVRDVTERRRVEAALRESEAKFREAFHGASVGIALVDPQGAFADWNDALERMFGYTGEELARLRFQDLLLPDDRAGSLAAFGALVRGDRDHNDMERRYVHKDGRILHLRYRTAALRDAAGRLHRVLGIVEDVTARIEAEAERRRMEAQLAQADRMASLGTLAAGVAHEINNPLTYVVSNVEVARETAEALADAHRADPRLAAPLQELREALGEAADGADRVRRIVGDLKVLSAPVEDRPVGEVDVAAILQSSANLARRLVSTRARLVEAFPGPLPIRGDPGRLGQVFLNLLVNAAQAVPEGAPERHRVEVSCRADGPAWVVVEVTDTGIGIPADQLPKIFEPFFTTKPQGVGTGLGLAICQSIVAAHGGEIRVETEPGRGSTFRVRLPRAAPVPGRTPDPAGRAPARRGRILVVDDEPFVLRAMERILAPTHDVVLAASAADALAQVGSGAAFDAVLCDVMMPGMNGMQLFGELSVRAPALARRFVFVTGGALVEEIRAFLEEAGAPVVEKPFAPAQILSEVGRIVGGTAA